MIDIESLMSSGVSGIPGGGPSALGLDRGRSYPQPLVKWAGGKRGILPQLQELMPPDVRPGFRGRLVEPFVGGAAMFFYLKPEEAILADSNQDLINLYIQVKEHLDDLRAALDELDGLEYCADTYMKVRERYRSDSYEQAKHDPERLVQRAAEFIFLNKWGWNGLYRVNKKGQFNVPFGRKSSNKKSSKPSLYDSENLRMASELLQRAELRIAAFEETMKDIRPGDFVYLDPPYHPISKTSAFTSYTKHDFSLEDQERLRNAIIEVDSRTNGQARIMLSNSVAPELLGLYRDYARLHMHRVTAFRAISARAASRGEQEELVVTNYIPPGAREDSGQTGPSPSSAESAE